jgi:hypothetical protein
MLSFSISYWVLRKFPYFVNRLPLKEGIGGEREGDFMVNSIVITFCLGETNLSPQNCFSQMMEKKKSCWSWSLGEWYHSIPVTMLIYSAWYQRNGPTISWINFFNDNFFWNSFKHLSESWSYGYLLCTHTSPCPTPPNPTPHSLVHITLQSDFLTRSLPAWQLHAFQYWLILWLVDILWRFYQRRNWGSYHALCVS